MNYDYENRSSSSSSYGRSSSSSPYGRSSSSSSYGSSSSSSYGSSSSSPYGRSSSISSYGSSYTNSNDYEEKTFTNLLKEYNPLQLSQNKKAVVRSMLIKSAIRAIIFLILISITAYFVS